MRKHNHVRYALSVGRNFEGNDSRRNDRLWELLVSQGRELLTLQGWNSIPIKFKTGSLNKNRKDYKIVYGRCWVHSAHQDSFIYVCVCLVVFQCCFCYLCCTLHRKFQFFDVCVCFFVFQCVFVPGLVCYVVCGFLSGLLSCTSSSI